MVDVLEQGGGDADLKALRSEAERELAMGRGRPSERPTAASANGTRPASPPRPDDLALERSGGSSLPSQVPCRSGLGVGPSSITSPILQRSTFAL